jgi:hypothetical protein
MPVPPHKAQVDSGPRSRNARLSAGAGNFPVPWQARQLPSPGESQAMQVWVAILQLPVCLDFALVSHRGQMWPWEHASEPSLRLKSIPGRPGLFEPQASGVPGKDLSSNPTNQELARHSASRSGEGLKPDVTSEFDSEVSGDSVNGTDQFGFRAGRSRPCGRHPLGVRRKVLLQPAKSGMARVSA